MSVIRENNYIFLPASTSYDSKKGKKKKTHTVTPKYYYKNSLAL
jgi:hypothetical protein